MIPRLELINITVNWTIALVQTYALPTFPCVCHGGRGDRDVCTQATSSPSSLKDTKTGCLLCTTTPENIILAIAFYMSHFM